MPGKLPIFSKFVFIITLAFTLSIPGRAQESISVETLENLNMRTGPGTNHDVVLTIPYDTAVTAVGRNADISWLQVNYSGTIGWVAAWLVSASANLTDLPVAAGNAPVDVSQSAPETSGTCTATNPGTLNVRSGPSTSTARIGQLRAGTIITPDARAGSSQEWIRFQFEGQEAWVAAWLLESDCDLSSLSVVSVPVLPLTIASFASCNNRNDLGGQMGGAYNRPDVLDNTYVRGEGGGCAVRLAYKIVDWSAFWIKLPRVDLTPYSQLTFDIRADAPAPAAIKIELKRTGYEEVSIAYISNIAESWQTRAVALNTLQTLDWAPPLSTLAGIDELVFVFEHARAGNAGTVYIDNIRFQ